MIGQSGSDVSDFVCKYMVFMAWACCFMFQIGASAPWLNRLARLGSKSPQNAERDWHRAFRQRDSWSAVSFH